MKEKIGITEKYMHGVRSIDGYLGTGQ